MGNECFAWSEGVPASVYRRYPFARRLKEILLSPCNSWQLEFPPSLFLQSVRLEIQEDVLSGVESTVLVECREITRRENYL